MDATFDDAAAVVAPGSGDIIGLFLPEQSLAAFNGLELSGNWTLEILDISSFPNEGIDLIAWSFNGILNPEPSTSTLLLFGMLGLGMLSRRGVALGPRVSPQRSRSVSSRTAVRTASTSSC